MVLLQEIWKSFRAMPVWVQIWVCVILVPVNMGGLFFLDTREGQVAAVLGIVGMLPNTGIIIVQRGFSKAMGFPHLLPWTILVVWLVWVLNGSSALTGALRNYLMVLLIVDFISLAFDYTDVIKWFRGDRDIAKKKAVN